MRARQRPQDHNQICSGPAIPGYDISHNDLSHEFIIDRKIVRLTRTEYTLCTILFHHMSGLFEGNLTPFNLLVSQKDLLKAVDPTCDENSDEKERDARKLLSRHIYNANVKLSECGISISGIPLHGYLLLFSPYRKAVPYFSVPISVLQFENTPASQISLATRR